MFAKAAVCLKKALLIINILNVYYDILRIYQICHKQMFIIPKCVHMYMYYYA